MKKQYTLLTVILVLLSGSILAQSLVSNVSEEGRSDKKKAINTDEVLNTHSTQAGGGFEGRWLNWGAYVDENYTGTAESWVFTLFPDSEIIRNYYLGEAIYPFRHAAATVIDPSAPDWEWLTQFSIYTLDSVSIGYSYQRNTHDSIVDTLRIDILKHNSETGGFADPENPHTWQNVYYDYAKNEVPANAILETIYYPLTSQEVTDELTINFLDLEVTQQSYNPQQRIGAVVTFLPGYEYAITDTLGMYNRFYLGSLEENGEGTEPTYWGNFNYSYILPKSVRYNNDQQNWNGYFVPTVAYVEEYEAEQHLIYFKVTPTNDVSVDELSNDMKLGQNQPNPFNSTTTINFELEKYGDNVKIEIYDLIGKSIRSYNLGSLSAGKHSLKVNADGMTPGAYFYSLTAGDKMLTKRMMLSE